MVEEDINDHLTTTLANSIQYIFATDLNALSSLALIILPASQFKGLSAAGSDNNAIIALHAD